MKLSVYLWADVDGSIYEWENESFEWAVVPRIGETITVDNEPGVLRAEVYDLVHKFDENEIVVYGIIKEAHGYFGHPDAEMLAKIKPAEYRCPDIGSGM